MENNRFKKGVSKTTRHKKCKKWTVCMISQCPNCEKRSYNLVKKHVEEHAGDYVCECCEKDVNWFWYCREKCGMSEEGEDPF